MDPHRKIAVTTLRLSLRGAPTDEIVEAAIRCGWLPDRPPDSLYAEGAGSEDWRARFVRTPVDAMAQWGDKDDPEATASHSRGELTVLSAKMDPQMSPVFACLEALPFTVAVIASLHPQWRRLGYKAPSLGGGLPPHGWLCAFRGPGHDRLVSRRWLEYGPWRLHHRPEDLSIVEFHDPAADAETALAQAKPGHRRMGITSEGGYIQPNFVYTCPPRGYYDPATGLLKVVVHGRPLTRRELLEACALRIETRQVEPGPVRNVAYVFMEEDEAQDNLHELWLRALECRAIRLGNEVRLDEEHQPEPEPPAWALEP